MAHFLRDIHLQSVIRGISKPRQPANLGETRIDPSDRSGCREQQMTVWSNRDHGRRHLVNIVRADGEMYAPSPYRAYCEAQAPGELALDVQSPVHLVGRRRGL